MAGKGGGAWKVAYADFVTAMMAFFMVMWITGQSKAVKKAVAQYFENPLSSRKGGGGSPILPFDKPGQPPGPVLLHSPKSSSAVRGDVHQRRPSTARGSTINTTGESPGKNPQNDSGKQSGLFVIHGGDRRITGTIVLFAEGGAELDAEAKERLAQVASELRGKPQKIEIRGHAARGLPPAGSTGEDPWQISYARCQATRTFLEQHGIEPERIRLSQGGAYEPYSLEVDPSKKVCNSRVEVYVLSELAEDLMGTPAERAKRFDAR